VTAALHAFMAFMAFNATVVFARGPTRWVAAAACAGLMVMLLRRARRGGFAGLPRQAPGQPTHREAAPGRTRIT
jgi:hypothetical protein